MDAIRPWLYIGRYCDTLDIGLLRTYGIQAMLQFAAKTAYLDIDYPLSVKILVQINTAARVAMSVMKEPLMWHCCFLGILP